jgi:hypothetical protein
MREDIAIDPLDPKVFAVCCALSIDRRAVRLGIRMISQSLGVIDMVHHPAKPECRVLGSKSGNEILRERGADTFGKVQSSVPWVVGKHRERFATPLGGSCLEKQVPEDIFGFEAVDEGNVAERESGSRQRRCEKSR